MNLELLKAFAEAPGAPGSETAVRRLFRETLQHVAPVHTDGMGNASCIHPNSPPEAPRVLITAHMDEVGFAIQSITPQGFLKIIALGGWWTHNLLAQRVTVLTQRGARILGVVGSKPPHFLAEGQRDKVLPIEQIFIDIGATSRQEAEEVYGVALGDAIVPDSAFTPFGNGQMAVCKAFDNRVGCAAMTQVMLDLAQETLPCELVAAATVQEEVGCRGAIVVGNTLVPDIAIVLEGTPADDTPGFDASESQGALGNGPQIRLMDPTALMNRPLVELIRATAKAENITHQIAVRRSGGTDAKSIHASGEGVPTVVIGVPARYIHSHNSIIRLADYQRMVDLVKAVIRQCDAATCSRLRQYD